MNKLPDTLSPAQPTCFEDDEKEFEESVETSTSSEEVTQQTSEMRRFQKCSRIAKIIK